MIQSLQNDTAETRNHVWFFQSNYWRFKYVQPLLRTWKKSKHQHSCKISGVSIHVLVPQWATYGQGIGLHRITSSGPRRWIMIFFCQSHPPWRFATKRPTLQGPHKPQKGESATQLHPPNFFHELIPKMMALGKMHSPFEYGIVLGIYWALGPCLSMTTVDVVKVKNRFPSLKWLNYFSTWFPGWCFKPQYI